MQRNRWIQSIASFVVLNGFGTFATKSTKRIMYSENSTINFLGKIRKRKGKIPFFTRKSKPFPAIKNQLSQLKRGENLFLKDLWKIDFISRKKWNTHDNTAPSSLLNRAEIWWWSDWWWERIMWNSWSVFFWEKCFIFFTPENVSQWSTDCQECISWNRRALRLGIFISLCIIILSNKLNTLRARNPSYMDRTGWISERIDGSYNETNFVFTRITLYPIIITPIFLRKRRNSDDLTRCERPIGHQIRELKMTSSFTISEYILSAYHIPTLPLWDYVDSASNHDKIYAGWKQVG